MESPQVWICILIPRDGACQQESGCGGTGVVIFVGVLVVYGLYASGAATSYQAMNEEKHPESAQHIGDW
jgi:ribonuclease HI